MTLGVLLGLVTGMPLGTFAVSLAVARLSRERLRPPVGWAAVLSAGTIAAVGFTVSLLVACLAFTGPRLDEAKLGLVGAGAGIRLICQHGVGRYRLDFAAKHPDQPGRLVLAIKADGASYLPRK